MYFDILYNISIGFEAPKERQRVKLLLASQEHIHPNLFSNVLRAMKPLIGLENKNYLVSKGGDDGVNDLCK